jgi:hypothetical protein
MKRLLALLVVPFLLSAPAWSQPERAQPHPEAPLLSVQFGGGTLNDYLNVLNPANSPQRINIMVPDGAREIEVPAVSLFNVSPSTAVYSLEFLTARNGLGLIQVQEVRGESSTPLYALKVSRDVEVLKTREATTRVFSLNELTRGEDQYVPVTGVEVIDDATLLATLAPTCGPIGLAEFGGRTYVLGECPQIGFNPRTHDSDGWCGAGIVPV